MSDLYLILHKVRGEPAFDIATPLDIGDEEGWVIPTSGHRAYPLGQWTFTEMEEAIVAYGIKYFIELPEYCINNDPRWAECPDHYQTNASPKAERASATSLLSSLGLPTKVHSAVSGTLKRRI